MEFQNDDNRAVAASGVSSVDGQTLILLRVNPTTEGVIVEVSE